MFDSGFHRIRSSAGLINWFYLALGAGVMSLVQPVGRNDLTLVTQWLTSSIPVPRWLFGLSLLVGTAVGITGLLASSRRDRLPELPRARYRSDEIEGIRWSWSWSPRSANPLVDLDTLVGSCMVCETPLEETRVYSTGVRRVALRCGTCDENRRELPLGTRFLDSFLEEVSQEIEARARKLENL